MLSFLPYFDADKGVRVVLEALGKAEITRDSWEKFLCTAKNDKLHRRDAREWLRSRGSLTAR